MRAFLERLQKRAQSRELNGKNTSADAFAALVVVEVVFAIALASVISPRHRAEAALGIGSHLIGFAASTLLGTAKWFDLIEDISILGMLWWSYESIGSAPSPRQIIAHACAAVWCIRLLAFVVFRVIARGSDWRFAKLSHGNLFTRNHGYHMFGWTSGGLWSWLNFFCVWQLADVDGKADASHPLGIIDAAGLFIFAAGFVLEIVSDFQKYAHNARYASGKSPTWIETGMWEYSRHPNYVGEVTLWVGMSIVCANGCLASSSVASALLCAVTPAWSFIFLFFTSLMLLEKRADAKWGGIALYEAYKARVPVFA